MILCESVLIGEGFIVLKVEEIVFIFFRSGCVNGFVVKGISNLRNEV